MADVTGMAPRVNELSTYELWTPERPGLFYQLPEGNFVQSEPDKDSADFSLLWSTDHTAQAVVTALLDLLEAGDVEGSNDTLRFEWDPPRCKMRHDTIAHATIILECSPLDSRNKLQRIIGATGTREVVEATDRVLDAFTAHIPALRRS